MSIIPKALTRVFIDDCDYDEVADEERQKKSDSRPMVRELGKIIDISISDIRTNPSQPRKNFSSDELTSLAKSISQDGIIQPLSVRHVENGFELISGERRLRAAKMAGMRSVPCILINADDRRSAVMSLIENIQRQDLSFFEEAQAIEKLINAYKLTQDEVAVRLGLAQCTVANKLRILRLSDEEKSIIVSEGLSERHARALLRLSDEVVRKQALLRIAKSKMNVTQAEKYIQKLEKDDIHKKSIKKSAVVLRDVKMFINTVNKAVDVMKLAGVNADAKRVDHDDYIEYIIRIPSENVATTTNAT